MKVAVGSTILQEHAFASPDSAWRRCGLFDDVGASVPLSMTELITSSAMAAMFAARRITGDGPVVDGAIVVVAVIVTVLVVISRVVDVNEVVVAALVVMVLFQ